ncbi:uncharacterized protein LOC106646537 [Copidosoma floridanum]|uniref:uncharacterized protein LOC106646537 n=1 Tax=Copidosoma floridanum TaxID=29053 RepID=UPI0006C93CCE|nr:uncharacterized protein LOC106646537 [Copidosoma floridanum]
MLFLWSRQPAALAASPKAGPYLAWFTTAVLLWRYGRRFARLAFGSDSAFRFLRRKRGGLLIPKPHRVPSPRPHSEQLQRPGKPTVAGGHGGLAHRSRVVKIIEQPKILRSSCSSASKEPRTGVRTRLKRLQAGDGPHMVRSSARKCLHVKRHIYYRMTRSGRIYGRYPGVK